MARSSEKICSVPLQHITGYMHLKVSSSLDIKMYTKSIYLWCILENTSALQP